MTTGLAGIFLGASVAILWGLADSMAGIAARRVGTMKTTLVEQAGGLIALALLGVLARVQLSLLVLSPAALMQSVLVGVLLGIVGTGAYFGLYRSLELGPWAIVSPVVGGQGAVTLILAVVFLHNQLDLIHLLLLVIILLGILLASTKIEQLTTQGRKLSAWLSRGVRFALLSMLCFGVLSFGLGAAASTTTSWFLILFWARLFCLIFVGCTALVVSPPSVAQEEPHRTREYLLAAGGGIVEVGGYIAFIAAAQLTSTAVAGVCASMVPLIPLLYGIFVLHERIHFNQCIGIVLALAGFIALPLDQGQSKWLLICIVGAVGAGVMVKQGHWTLPAPVFARKSRSPTDRSRKKWWPG